MLGIGESAGEGYPVRLPGVKKILSSNKIRQFDTPELEHYFSVYCNINRYGLPFGNWTETPLWVLRLMAVFDGAMRECSEYRRNKGNGKWRD